MTMGPSPQRVHSTSPTRPRGWQARQCRPSTTAPELSGLGCSHSAARSARSWAASPRVLGSCPQHGTTDPTAPQSMQLALVCRFWQRVVVVVGVERRQLGQLLVEQGADLRGATVCAVRSTAVLVEPPRVLPVISSSWHCTRSRYACRYDNRSVGATRWWIAGGSRVCW